MSQKNSEIALQQIDALNRGDVDAFVDLVSPDVEWEDAMFWSEPMRIHRGKTELGEWLNQVLEPWESASISRSRRSGKLQMIGSRWGLLTTRGKGSGAETQTRGCFVNWIANGKVKRRQVFLDRAEAVVAAGLTE